MRQDCAGATNNAALCKMEKVMGKGGCQELQSAHVWKCTKVAGVKTQKIMISVLRIKYIEEKYCENDRAIN